MSGSLITAGSQILRSSKRLMFADLLSTTAAQISQLATGQDQTVVNSPNTLCHTETEENKNRCGLSEPQRNKLAKHFDLKCITFKKPKVPCGTKLAKWGREDAENETTRLASDISTQCKPKLRLRLGDSSTASSREGKKKKKKKKSSSVLGKMKVKIKVPKIKAPAIMAAPKTSKPKDNPGKKDAKECLNACRPCQKYETSSDVTSLEGIGCKGGRGTVNCSRSLATPTLPKFGPKMRGLPKKMCGEDPTTAGGAKCAFPTIHQADLRQRVNDICTLPAFKDGQCRTIQLEDEYKMCKLKGCWKCKLIRMGTVKGFACSRMHKSGNVKKSTYCKAYLMDSADQGFTNMGGRFWRAEGAAALPIYKSARLIDHPILKETRCIDGPEGSACQETKINTCSRIRKWDLNSEMGPECAMDETNEEIAKFF